MGLDPHRLGAAWIFFGNRGVDRVLRRRIIDGICAADSCVSKVAGIQRRRPLGQRDAVRAFPAIVLVRKSLRGSAPGLPVERPVGFENLIQTGEKTPSM